MIFQINLCIECGKYFFEGYLTMPRKGENVYHRKDGLWEARYVKSIDAFGKKKYGEAYGIINSSTQVGLALGSLIVAAIYDMSGAYTMAWVLMIVCTGVTLAGWMGSIFLAKKYK